MTLLTAASTFAGTVTWTDWSSASVGNSGSASGALGAVSVRYSGDVASSTQVGNSGGPYYYSEPNSSLKPYTANSVIGNLPVRTDIITIDTENSLAVNTVTFSSPVLNPVMLLVSLGQNNYPVSYSFDPSLSLSLLSSGQGYWGGAANSLTLAGNTITGIEGHGAIQINGLVSSISWSTAPDEYWHGFTVGVPTATGTVPDMMSTFSALMTAVGSLVGFRRFAK